MVFNEFRPKIHKNSVTVYQPEHFSLPPAYPGPSNMCRFCPRAPVRLPPLTPPPYSLCRSSGSILDSSPFLKTVPWPNPYTSQI